LCLKTIVIFQSELNTLRLIAFTVIATLSLPRTVNAAIASDSDSILRKISAFALGGVGEAGSMSAGERALRELLKQPDAVARLEHMLPDASAPGQLYALLGLRARDREAYQRALARYGQRDVTVQTMRGCILQQEPFISLVKQIDRGDYDASLVRDWPGPVR
jgi:ethanolamine utilization cobalamin adenosyltransferase